jgi:hypothetical protein
MIQYRGVAVVLYTLLVVDDDEVVQNPVPTGVLQWCYGSVILVLQWCYRGTIVVERWCYSVVQWCYSVLQWCYSGVVCSSGGR